MTQKVIKKLEDHLWYPILIPHAGGHRIVEMLGRRVNEWNEMVRLKEMGLKIRPKALFY